MEKGTMVSSLRALLWKAFGRHQWSYENKQDRKCTVCGRHESSYYESLETSASPWRVKNEGDERKHYEIPV